jgi:hypothetical protein
MDRSHLPQLLHGKAGDVLELTYFGSRETAERSEFSFLELRRNNYVTNHFNLLKIDGGLLKVGPLPAGIFELVHKPSSKKVEIRVVAGAEKQGFVHGKTQRLELPHLASVGVAKVAVNEKDIQIQVQNASPGTRVHVMATRLTPRYNTFASFSQAGSSPSQTFPIPRFVSFYLNTRAIGDEYRYILDRRLEKRYPGNMLNRPGLLLNPWAVRNTETSLQQAAQDEALKSMMADGLAAEARKKMANPTAADPEGVVLGNSYSQLDFLQSPAVILANLTANEAGMVTIPRAALQDRQHIQLVVVDAETTLYHWLSLPEKATQVRDLRLIKGLDPKQHFAQQKQVSYLKSGEKLVLPDISGSRFEVYDSVSKVYSLMLTLSDNEHLREFQFITRWHNMKPAEKQELYSKYACHELNFFLFKKDAPFFQEVVLPYFAKQERQDISRSLVSKKQFASHASAVGLWSAEHCRTHFVGTSHCGGTSPGKTACD